ncbi:MAG: YihY/virulence factor BrkB family protein [Bacilli bacterium]
MDRIKKIGQSFLKIIIKPEMGILPGQIAFFLVLSIIPLITLIGYICGLFSMSIDTLSNFIVAALPPEIIDSLLPYVLKETSTFNTIIFMVLGFIVASNGCYSIIVACNTLYQIPGKNYLKKRLKALILTMLLVTLFLFTIAVLAFGDIILNAIIHFGFLEAMSKQLYYVLIFLKWPFAFIIVFIFIKLIYKIAPDQNVSSKEVNKGAIFTTFSWILATALYAYYVNYFANYDIFYGNLANIVIIMMWIYILSYVLVIGIVINVNNYNLAKKG